MGLDRDPEALRAAAKRLANQGHRVTLHHATFDALEAVLDNMGFSEISAMPVRSRGELDPTRPPRHAVSATGSTVLLDMRMDPATALTAAADIVNEVDEHSLAGILRRNADERYARRIAAAIVAQRPFATTTQLSRAVAAAVPAAARRRTHPARRTFQALRIEVNGELETLEEALTAAIARLSGAGRCAVLSYHSGEDRIVKSLFRRAAGESPPPRPGLPPVPGSAATVRLLSRRARTPTESEKAANHRAGSARLRAVERLIRDV